MTTQEFEKVYEASYTKALNAARKVSPEHAEDGVADAAVYLLENLDRYQQITPSYFVQACVHRTRDRIKRAHYETVTPVGLSDDLATREEMQERSRRGIRSHGEGMPQEQQTSWGGRQ